MPDQHNAVDAPSYGPDALAREFALPADVMARLMTFDDLFLSRQAQMNLIARSTIDARWSRHYRDSLQLVRLIPAETRSLVDLGSGSGFPGIVLAAIFNDALPEGDVDRARKTVPETPPEDGRRAPSRITVTLVESIGKKAAFLVEAGARMGLSNLTVKPERIENLSLPAPDVVTARALAPLVKLCGYAAEITGEKTVCLFHKGQDVENELTQATKSWNMDVKQHTSLTNPDARILAIRYLRPTQKPQRSSTGRAHRNRK